jgi:UDP-2,4-diacetamido-2,4,6-trideoxy-beta-L-altropyranose hydrolase
VSDAPRILFFANAGPEVGGGHVMRSLTLARALTEAGAECAFVESRAAAPILRRFGWPAQTLLAMIGVEGLEPLLHYAESFATVFEPDVVVVDHYEMGAAEERRLRGDGRRLAVIDDLANRAHDCELLVDPGYGRRLDDYSGLAPSAAPRLVGPTFALVRPEFGGARPRAMSRRAKHEPVRRVLVSLGLTDLGGITQRVVTALAPVLGEARLEVVIGAEAASLPGLRELAAADRRVRLWIDTQEMATLMADTDLCIGAGGSSVWERAVVGLPTVTLALADNQRPMIAQMDAAGITLGLDAAAPDFEHALQTAFNRLVDEADLRWRLAQRTADLCDGQGAVRVAEAVLRL